MPDPSFAPLLRRFIPWVLALAVGALYVFSLSPAAFPGQSAALIATHASLTPFTPMDDALWGVLAKFVGEISSPAVLSQRLNLLSALFGVASVFTLFLVMARLPTSMAPAPVATRRFSISTSRAIGATVASLYLGLSLPFWIVSTRAHTSTLDVFMLLASVYALLRFRTSRKLAWAFAGCLLFCLGLTCSATLFFVAPIYGVLLLVYLLQSAKLRTRNVILLSLAVPLGFLPDILQAFHFAASPTYGWRAFDGIGQVFYYMLREQYQVVKYSVPKSGWLLVGLVSILPWLVVVVFRLGQERKIAPTSRIGGFVLNVLLTIIGALVSLGIAIDPYRHGNAQDPLVIPYVFIAMWYGALASFWYSELVLFTESNRHNRPAAWRKPTGLLTCALMVAAIVAAAVRHFPVADGRSSAFSTAYVQETLDAAQGKDWMVTGGQLQDNLLVGAAEQRSKLRLLSLAYGSSTPYLSYLATLFDQPRLQAMAKVGLIPLLNEWMSADPTIVERLAVQAQPEIWYTTGRYPVPDRVFFSALPKLPPNPEVLFQEHQKVWDRLARADTPVDPRNPAAPYNLWVRSHLSKVANNLGVYLEDAGRADLAQHAYTRSRLFNTNNLSALLNLYVLAKREKQPDLEKMESQIKQVVKALGGRPMIWALSTYYGFVRTPESYAQNGWAWALSGKPNLGLEEMRRAIELSGNSQNLQMAMAGMYMAQENVAEGEKKYLAVLQKNPTNQAALFGLVRTSMSKRNFEETRGYLQRLRELKAPVASVQIEEAVLASLTGDSPGAQRILQSLVKDQPKHWLAWTALALTANDLGDAKTTQTALEKLQQAPALTPNIRLALAEVALKNDDKTSARRHLEAALATNPSFVKALESLIRLDIIERQRELAERHVQYLISMDSRNKVGNYVLGSLQTFNGQYALAETSYRAALAVSRTPDVLNDLAWVLAKQGKLAEALPVAEESVQKAPSYANGWDTLGFIQFKKGDLAAAEKSLQKAVGLQPDNLAIMLRMAQVYDAKGMTKEALQLAEELMASASKLDPDTLDELNALMKKLRQRGPG